MNDVDIVLQLIDRFHITDRSLLRARENARRQGDAASISALSASVRRYFESMLREEEKQLVEIDRRLDDIYQRQYNLQAERGVAQRRLNGARQVLQALEKVGTGTAGGSTRNK